MDEGRAAVGDGSHRWIAEVTKAVSHLKVVVCDFEREEEYGKNAGKRCDGNARGP